MFKSYQLQWRVFSTWHSLYTESQVNRKLGDMTQAGDEKDHWLCPISVRKSWDTSGAHSKVKDIVNVPASTRPRFRRLSSIGVFFVAVFVLVCFGVWVCGVYIQFPYVFAWFFVVVCFCVWVCVCVCGVYFPVSIRICGGGVVLVCLCVWVCGVYFPGSMCICLFFCISMFLCVGVWCIFSRFHTYFLGGLY